MRARLIHKHSCKNIKANTSNPYSGAKNLIYHDHGDLVPEMQSWFNESINVIRHIERLKNKSHLNR